MEQIDYTSPEFWAKAPEGATHWEPQGVTILASWMRLDQDGWWWWSEGKKRWELYRANLPQHRVDAMIQRPSPWNGTGLPPVGIECECCYTSPSEYYRVKIIAHDDEKAVFRWIDGPKQFELGDCKNYTLGALTHHHPKFRPIRTHEQIEAEERDKAVDELCETIVGHYGSPKMSEHYLGLARALYDAGYRKIDTSQPSPAEISSDIKQANLNRLAEKVLAVSVARRLTAGGNAEVSLHGLIELVALAKELKQ